MPLLRMLCASVARKGQFAVGGIALVLALAGCAAVPAQPAAAPAQPLAPNALPTAAPPSATAVPPSPTPVPPSATAEPSPTTAPPTAAPATPTAQPLTSYLVYPKADGSLWRVDGAGTAPIQLIGSSEPGALPPWAAAPDGRTIAVVSGLGVWNTPSDHAPEAALWLVGADGRNPRKIQDVLPAGGVDLTPGGDDAMNVLPALVSLQELAWSPDGGLVAFASSHEGQVDLYAASPDGAVVRLTDTPAFEQGPRWSPDGTKLAFRTTSAFGTGAGWGDVGLGVAARNGEPLQALDAQALASGRELGAIPDLLWLGPDSLVAGLWSGASGKDEVRAITISSSAVATVFDQPYSKLDWSEAIRQLAIAGASESVISSQPAGTLLPGFYIWMPGAGEPIRVIAGPIEALAWNPLGDALAYSMAPSGKQPGVGLWALLMDGDLRHLDGAPTAELRWSPDGQRLAAGAAVYDREGQKLAELPGQHAQPAGWSQAGLFFFVQSEDGQATELSLWDGATARRLDAGLGRPVGAVVTPKG